MDPDRHEPDAALIYVTFPSVAAAEAAAEPLVTERLAACANILPGVRSIYVWDGQLQREGEVAMLVKTRAALAQTVVARIRALHPYDTPAIVVLPIIGGSAPFLAWIAAQTTHPGTLERSAELD